MHLFQVLLIFSTEIAQWHSRHERQIVLTKKRTLVVERHYPVMRAMVGFRQGRKKIFATCVQVVRVHPRLGCFVANLSSLRSSSHATTSSGCARYRLSNFNDTVCYRLETSLLRVLEGEKIWTSSLTTSHTSSSPGQTENRDATRLDFQVSFFLISLRIIYSTECDVFGISCLGQGETFPPFFSFLFGNSHRYRAD